MLKTFFAAVCFAASFVAHAANPQVEFKTSLGSFIIEVYPDKAPQTVENFLQYVKDGFFDGTVFHRVIPNFMIQGGGFTAAFAQKKTRGPVKNEADNGLKNVLGAVAMARTADPHSATAQFFINTMDNSSLDYRAPTREGYGYTVFGKVVKGMEIVGRIERVETTSRGPHGDVPVKPVVIERAQLVSAQPAPAAKPAKK